VLLSWLVDLRLCPRDGFEAHLAGELTREKREVTSQLPSPTPARLTYSCTRAYRLAPCSDVVLLPRSIVNRERVSCCVVLVECARDSSAVELTSRPRSQGQESRSVPSLVSSDLWSDTDHIAFILTAKVKGPPVKKVPGPRNRRRHTVYVRPQLEISRHGQTELPAADSSRYPSPRLDRRLTRLRSLISTRTPSRLSTSPVSLRET
jgi:hypothetical protein